MKNCRFFVFFLLIVFPNMVCLGKIFPSGLLCEYMKDPAVVDVKQPRLSWINNAGKGERGQMQTGWQIRVASSPGKLEQPDLWDSHKVTGDQSSRIVYQGNPMKSRMECWWQVRVWDRNGKVSAWSKPAFWRMGFLDTAEWTAQWIGAPWQDEKPLPKPANPNALLPPVLPPPAPMFRKEFIIDRKVEKAVAFVTGLGYFELYLNGEKVGNDVLVPNQTNYGKRPGLMNENIPLEDDFRDYRVMYLAYDLKHQLKKGTNALGCILGNGFYNPAKYWTLGYGTPRFLAQVFITYSDGSEEIISSDETWKASRSPIVTDMVYYGEHYDARLEQPGWNNPGFDDRLWESCVLRKAPEGKLVAHTAWPDRVMERLEPVKIEKLPNGNFLVDFGVEISGWIRLSRIRATPGHKIEIRYLSSNYSGDNSYICSGKSQETYAARFNWFVFRSAEIINWPGELSPDQISAETVYTYVEESAEFETSNPLFNDINKIWRRSQTDNMHGGIASDCPHRERAPYTGDGQVACVTVMHNFDARSFYHKWIQDILEAQDVSTGYVPNGAPWQPGCGGGVGWGAAVCIMPWEFYLHYGDLDLLGKSYPGMKEYIRYMQGWVDPEGIMYSQRKGRNGQVLKWFNLGDWVAPGDLPPDAMVHTFYFWRCTSLTALAATALGKTEEAKEYEVLAERTRRAFMDRFRDQENGSYGKAGGNIFALKMGVPSGSYQQVSAALKMEIIANNGNLNTGIFGTQFFFEVLAENGMNDLAFEAMNKRTQPGFGWWISQGATTTWEQWSGDNSRNHPMFGGGLTWFYRKLAGMNADPEEPGYRHIIFRPQPAGGLSYVKYNNLTPFGKAGIFWENESRRFRMEVTVPVGSRATVYVPLMNGNRVSENTQSPAGSAEVQFLRDESGYRVFSLQSGQYRFVSE